MSSPPVLYARQAAFADYQAAHPNDPPLGSDLDAECDAIRISLNKAIQRLSEIQRDDGLLRNQSVHKDALTTEVLAFMLGVGVPRGGWLTLTAYLAKDLVSQAGSTYIAVSAHTSGTFATDLAAGKWLLLAPAASSAIDVRLSSYATLALADVAAVALGGALTLDTNMSIAADTSLNAKAIVAAGGVITLNGHTLSVFGALPPIPLPWLSLASGGGTLRIGSAANQWPNVSVGTIWPEFFGAAVNYSAAVDDTSFVQAAINTQGPVKFARDYSVSHIDLTSSEHNIDGNNFFLRARSGSAQTSLLDIRCSYSSLRNLKLDGALLTNYECVVHLYNNNTNLYNVHNNRIDGLFVRYGKIGLCIGALPSQADPIPAALTVNAVGVASNAQISETDIKGFLTYGCIKSLYMRQPNGKITMTSPKIEGATNEWSSPDLTAVSALEMLSSSELTILGGTIEQNTSTDAQGGRGVDLRQSAHLITYGTCIEQAARSYLANSAVWDHFAAQDHGFNGGQAYDVDTGWDGALKFTGGRILMPANQAAVGPSCIRATTGGFGTLGVVTPAPCLKGLIVFNNVTLQDMPFNNGASAYNPLCSGVRNIRRNCLLQTYASNGTTLNGRARINDGQNLLVSQMDVSAKTIDAYLAATTQNANGSDGGYDFVVANGGLWGSQTSGLPTNTPASSADIPDELFQAALVLDATAGVTAAVSATTTTAFALPVDGRLLVWTALVKCGSGTGTSLIRILWYDFAGTALSGGDASTDLYNGAQATLVGTSYTPIMLRVQPPKGAHKAKILYSSSASGAMFIVQPWFG